jgi:hypothetical protein
MLINQKRDAMKSSKIAMLTLMGATLSSTAVFADSAAHTDHAVADSVITEQRAALAKNTTGEGFGPQSPRDIDAKVGENSVQFSTAPKSSEMNLCNIHFHKYAEHKGGEFTKFMGNGDGMGNGTGFAYSGKLSADELKPTAPACPSSHGGLVPGDTIEVHYVHSTADVIPGESLGACLSPSIKNPQFRVEAQVYVLVNDESALDFAKLAEVREQGSYYQAVNIPKNSGSPVEYAGSTTGPKYNEEGSPFQVTWSVRPKVQKVNIATVGEWCKGNEFNEDHAHGVRNLVTNPALLSNMK